MSTKSQEFQMKLQKTAGKISENKYLKSLSNGLMSTLPAMIIGALASLLGNINLESYQNFIGSTGLDQMFSALENMTLGIVSIYAVFFIAFKLAENFGEQANGSAGAGLIALMSFMILTPLAQLDEADVIPFQFLGAQGLFVAIIIGIISSRIYIVFIQSGWTIKLPDGVPPTVSKTFSNLTPAIVIALLFGIVGMLFKLTSYGSVHQFIYSVIQAPLQGIGDSYGSLVVVILIIHILWFFGIHGGLVVQPIIMGVWLPLGLENLDAISAGGDPTNILHPGFHYTFISLGGAGAALGLSIVMAFMTKSKRYKTLGRLAFPGTLFGINEPLIFGTPIILNPYMFIPFVVAPLINGSLIYFLMYSGIVPLTNGFLTPLGTPVFVNGLLQGSIIFAVLQLIGIVISALLYYPFVKKIDRDALRDEQQEVENN